MSAILPYKLKMKVMQKSILTLSSLSCIVVMNLVLSSCSNDEPFVKPKLSMAKSAITVNEAVGTIDVEVKLDKAFSSDITAQYTLGGTAIEGSSAQSDYQIIGSIGDVDIKSGQTTGVIKLSINPDAIFEGNETIEIRIKDVDSDQIDITTDDKIVITINDDDVRAKLAFTSATASANEEDRNIAVQVTLDKALLTDITVQYSLSGTATDSVAGAVSTTDGIFPDYQAKGTVGQFTIPAGQTTGTIVIKAYSDFYLEDDETIIITLLGAGNQVEIGAIASTEITLVQENGRAIALYWDPAYTTVDMDLFLWIGDVGTPAAELDGPIAFSAFADFEAPEIVFVPSAVTDATFGMSYNYYEGDEDPMDFEVDFVDFVDGVFTVAETSAASYTLANVNPWDDQVNGIEPIVVQTFDVVAGVYSKPSAITVPTAGSRVASPAFSPTIAKQHKLTTPSRRIRTLAKILK
ncbi:MAG: hypothetical protein OEV74_21705 [Cyclobacteriaceae bacterium]|nr:hypothetical protein [Cyclobacteriaceae bacterium]MDH4298900.1 hypothetical protein [Cyclobacteriaceae bacterium]MDH5250267.1 hypothetical protein [Cyclobacteriaceae bacterium]